MTQHLLDKARAGHKVTLVDKFEAETTVESLDALEAGCRATGQHLTETERQAFTRCRAELMRRKR